MSRLLSRVRGVAHAALGPGFALCFVWVPRARGDAEAGAAFLVLRAGGLGQASQGFACSAADAEGSYCRCRQGPSTELGQRAGSPTKHPGEVARAQWSLGSCREGQRVCGRRQAGRRCWDAVWGWHGGCWGWHAWQKVAGRRAGCRIVLPGVPTRGQLQPVLGSGGAELGAVQGNGPFLPGLPGWACEGGGTCMLILARRSWWRLDRRSPAAIWPGHVRCGNRGRADSPCSRAACTAKPEPLAHSPGPANAPPCASHLQLPPSQPGANSRRLQVMGQHRLGPVPRPGRPRGSGHSRDVPTVRVTPGPWLSGA